MLPGASYEVHSRQLEHGERLLLYTDGLSEAMRPDGTDFGLDRIRATFLATRDWATDAVLVELFEAARAFTGQPRFADDATGIVLQID
jgi:sigma-B regulation protein RsbU (phosphoserine phosphatase)